MIPDQRFQSPFDQAIVLPILSPQTEKLQGMGLGLHFLIGNVLVLNRRLKEMWFGWRVRKLFPEAKHLLAYCRGEIAAPDFLCLAAEQKIRYWFSGRCTRETLFLNLTDTGRKQNEGVQPFSIHTEDHLIGFRKAFMDWAASFGIRFDAMEREAALWPERISPEGLAAVGQALLAFYALTAYDNPVLEIAPFIRAAACAPSSFMAQDLLGWARYRREEFEPARAAFEAALQKNPQGVGAMAGLMWCAVKRNHAEEALDWAVQKAELRGENIQKVREKTFRLLQRYRSPERIGKEMGRTSKEHP